MLISPQTSCVSQASPPLWLMDPYFITSIVPVNPAPRQLTHLSPFPHMAMMRSRPYVEAY